MKNKGETIKKYRSDKACATNAAVKHIKAGVI